jgi:hypothetical protein
MITRVAIFDQKSLRELWETAIAIKASINPQAKLMEHPVETGATITDHRVKMPTDVQLSLILKPEDYRSVYQSIFEAYNNATLLTVQTRAETIQNMIIASMPHDEEPDMIDTVAVAVTLKEVVFITPQYSTFKVAEPKQSSTVDRGQQQGKETPPEKKKSVLASLFS